MSSSPCDSRLPDLDSQNELPEVPQADLDRTTFRAGLKLAPAQTPYDDPA